MNYLAHACLSFGKPEILVGNLIADFVRGKQQYTYDAAIQTGIRLHRAIDGFTDNHEATRRAKKLMAAACGKYSGVFTDVIYDHFLALDTQYFNGETLQSFAQQTYHTLEAYKNIFPERFRRVFFYMREYDWLSGYRFKKNIARAFGGIYHRAEFLSESDAAFLAFEQHYKALQHCYILFMPDLLDYASDYLARSSK